HVASLVGEYGLVETGRKSVDQVDIARELAMLLLCHAARNKDPQMPDRFMNHVDDRLPIASDLIDVLVEIENPIERLLWWGDVVALRTEHHDRRTDVPQIDRSAVRGSDASGGQLVADEQLIDDGLYLCRVQNGVAAPPFLESKIARPLRIDF